jgi:polar amino acid transport system permease protein
MHQSAYMAEVVRAGIESIAVGQMEAGLSSGMTRLQVMRKIILPQGLVIVIPPLTTQVLETLKNSSIAMTIAIPELTFQTQQIEAYSFRGFEAATAATVMYLLMGVMIAGGSVALESWLSRRKLGIQPVKSSYISAA